MQGWVRELGAAGMVHPDTVRFFVSAYLGSSGGHRTVFMLLDIRWGGSRCAGAGNAAGCAARTACGLAAHQCRQHNPASPCALPVTCRSLVALAKELGSEAPQASLPGAADVLAPAAATATLQHDRAANAAAAAARRAGQGRLDSVVAAMQRVKQLHVQAARQLAGSTAASGGEAAQLAPRVPPLFVGSQVDGACGGGEGYCFSVALLPLLAKCKSKWFACLISHSYFRGSRTDCRPPAGAAICFRSC